MPRNKQRKPQYGKKRRLDFSLILSMVVVGIIFVPLGVFLICRHYESSIVLVLGILLILSPLLVLLDDMRSPERKVRDEEEAQMVKTALMMDYLLFNKKKSKKKKGSDSWLEQTGGHSWDEDEDEDW